MIERCQNCAHFFAIPAQWIQHQTAEGLKVSPETVMPDWKVAKVRLLHELKGQNRDEA